MIVNYIDMTLFYIDQFMKYRIYSFHEYLLSNCSFCLGYNWALLSWPLYILVWTRVASQRRRWHATPVPLPGKSHGRRSLVGCSPWGRYKSDTTEQLHFHFSLLCIGEGNGNPLQCSCLENPRDGGAWWAAVYESRTLLKWFSSSSSRVASEY